MHTSTVHTACEPPADQRSAIENLLGRPLQEDETVELNAPAAPGQPRQDTAKHVNATPPVWPGRVTGELRREDIYDDAE